MEPIRKKILLTYAISLGVSTILMLWLWLTGETSLNWTTIILFCATKFIAGFGLMLTLTSVAIIFLTKYSDKFKQNKTRLTLFNWVLLIIVPIVLLVYYFVKIFLTYFNGPTEHWWDNILFIYGIVSLLISLYIRPTINENMMEATETTTGDKAKRVMKDLGRGLKKRWFTWRKDYAKATVQDALTLKEVGQLTKQRVAIIMLPVISIGSLLFTPIAIICGIFFIELAINADLIHKPERGALIVAMIAIAVISFLLPFARDLFPFAARLTEFYDQARSYWWILSLVYFSGLLISTFLFVKKLLNMQGYNLLAWRQKRVDKRKEDLKEAHGDIKSREKELKAQEKDLQKKIKAEETRKAVEMKKLQEEQAKYPDN